jgi:hydroxymethylglutaryl-CoA synthase
MPEKRQIGIDAISVYVPRLFIDTSELAEVRNVDPSKYVNGLGCEKIAVTDTYEDAATMAANSIWKLMQDNGLNKEPEKIGRIYVATESNDDMSKTIAIRVHGMLEGRLGKGSLRNVGAVDYKEACVSPAYVVEGYADWLLSGRSKGKVGIIATTDIAKYGLKTDAEPTQGAGSVAMILKEDPRLLAFEPLDDLPVFGTYTHDVPDFWHPNDLEVAKTLGPYSDWCYQQAMKYAYADWAKEAKRWIPFKEDEALTDHVDVMCPHLPYSNQGKKFLTYVLRHEWQKLPKWAGIVEKIGPEPKLECEMPKEDAIEAYLFEKCVDRTDFKTKNPAAWEAVDNYLYKDDEFRKKFAKTPEFEAAFKNKMDATLIASRQVGNIYTGSAWLGIASMFERKLQLGCKMEGKRIGIGSYGSGCSAKVFSAIVQPGWKDATGKIKLFETLDRRVKLTIKEYEALHNGKTKKPSVMLTPSNEFVLKEIGQDKLHGYRFYAFAE